MAILMGTAAHVAVRTPGKGRSPRGDVPAGKAQKKKEKNSRSRSWCWKKQESKSMKDVQKLFEVEALQSLHLFFFGKPAPYNPCVQNHVLGGVSGTGIPSINYLWSSTTESRFTAFDHWK